MLGPLPQPAGARSQPNFQVSSYPVRRFCLLRIGSVRYLEYQERMSAPVVSDGTEAQVEAAENGLTHPEHVMTPTRNPSAGERARKLLVRANEVMASAPLPLPRSPFTRTRAARPNEGMACPATGAEMAPSASEDAAQDVSDSCTICMSSPRAVRFLPCRHAVMCEVCAMTEMKRTGMCSHCRQPVEGLVFVPVTPLRPKRLKTHQDEPEPEGLYQSKQEFLQQAGAAGRRSQTGAAGRPTHAAAATAAAQSGRRDQPREASSECCDATGKFICCGLCTCLLFIAGSIVMIIMSESIKQGWFVTEVLCNATNEWQCEFYQMATECRDTTDIGDDCTEVEHYIPTFSVGGGTWQWEQASGPYDFGELGNISEQFSCSRYKIIEPAGIKQCQQMAANLTGSVKACHFDEDSGTCYAGAAPHDEATARALLITGIVFLLICTLPCAYIYIDS